MRTLRVRLGERLLAAGTEMAFDARDIGRRAGPAAGDPVLAQTLALIGLVSRMKVRLGLVIMPSVPEARPSLRR